MKKILGLAIALCVLFMLLPIEGRAAQLDNAEVTYFADGSYMIDTVEALSARTSGSVTGNRTRTYYSNDGKQSWKVVLTGAFSYTGSSSKCTSSSCNVTIYDSAWSYSSKNAGKSGNTATASVTMEQRILGVVRNKVPVSLTLSCDANGNLS